MKDDLEQAYRQHRRGLYSLAVSITGCAEQAEDAIHAAFEKLCRRDVQFPGDLPSYVFAAVRNSAIDLRRRDQRARQIATTVFNGYVPQPSNMAAEDHFLTAERDQLLRTAIEELTDDDREIVVMKAFGQLTFDEIAKVTNRPAAAVATRFRRALGILHQRLKANL